MHIYISGGYKNGKSHLAQRLAKVLGMLLYYAPAQITLLRRLQECTTTEGDL